MRNRFFDIDIFSRLDGPKGGQRMPMIGGCNGDDIHIRIFEKLADVGVAFDFLALVFTSLDFVFENLAIDITKGNQASALDSGHAFEVVGAASIEADDGIADLRVRTTDTRDGG